LCRDSRMDLCLMLVAFHYANSCELIVCNPGWWVLDTSQPSLLRYGPTRSSSISCSGITSSVHVVLALSRISLRLTPTSLRLCILRVVVSMRRHSTSSLIRSSSPLSAIPSGSSATHSPF
jgi:hypothetical protein